MLSAEIVQWMRDSQRVLDEMVFSQLQSFQQGHPVAAVLGLMAVGFLYGIAHAVGPGHGKVVVSSYMLANKNSLRRGLAIIALSSLLQAVTSIALVLGFYFALDATRSEAEHAARYLEIASFFLVGCLGLALAAQGCRDFWQLVRAGVRPRHCPSDHTHSCCQHAHAPSPQIMDKNPGVASMAAIIFSVGIRPCTGSLLLLFFSCMAGLTFPGALAVFAMAVGTAATTGALAFTVVQSRNLALKFVDKSDKALRVAHAGFRLAGGAFIFLFAALFLMALSGPGAAVSDHAHPLYKSLR